MSTDISELRNLSGFIGACLVDSDTGFMLGSEEGDPSFNLEVAAAANTEVLRAKLEAMKMVGLGDDHIEDILISLGRQYHLIRPLATNQAVFVYVALDRKTSNLGMARLALKNVEATLKF